MDRLVSWFPGILIALIPLTMIILLVAGIVRSFEPELESGVVIAREHHPERRWVQVIMIPITNRVGDTTITTHISVPTHHRSPEHWVIVLEGTVEIRGEERTRQRRLYVTEEVYDMVFMGEAYIVDQLAQVNYAVERRDATSEEVATYGTNG